MQSTEKLKKFNEGYYSWSKRRKGMTSDEANEFVQDILNKRVDLYSCLIQFTGNKRVLKERKI